jgi:hypothetical protein
LFLFFETGSPVQPRLVLNFRSSCFIQPLKCWVHRHEPLCLALNFVAFKLSYHAWHGEFFRGTCVMSQQNLLHSWVLLCSFSHLISETCLCTRTTQFIFSAMAKGLGYFQCGAISNSSTIDIPSCAFLGRGQDRILLCSPRWPLTCDSPASAS